MVQLMAKRACQKISPLAVKSCRYDPVPPPSHISAVRPFQTPWGARRQPSYSLCLPLSSIIFGFTSSIKPSPASMTTARRKIPHHLRGCKANTFILYMVSAISSKQFPKGFSSENFSTGRHTLCRISSPFNTMLRIAILRRFLTYHIHSPHRGSGKNRCFGKSRHLTLYCNDSPIIF